MVILLGSLSLSAAFADSHKRNTRGMLNQPGNLVEDSRPAVKISSRRAASLVKQRYGDTRVLGVSLLEKGGSPVYRVKTLSNEGVVKSVFVDGNSGEVFE